MYEDLRAIHDKDILLPPQPEQHGALDELTAARLAQAVGVASAEAEDLDVVPVLGAGQGEDGGREEHGLVVRVGDQQADLLAAQRWVARLRRRARDGVQEGQETEAEERDIVGCETHTRRVACQEPHGSVHGAGVATSHCYCFLLLLEEEVWLFAWWACRREVCL